MPSHVIYARKSTESEDKQVLSIDSQIHELQMLAERHGVAVGQVYREMQSAKIPGRPVFNEVMHGVKRGQISGIICWKMDRLARNPLDSGTVLQALLDGQLREIVTPERTYGATSTDQLIGNFELGLATKYSLDLSQNVRRGNRAKLNRGWLTHTPPLGYLMVRDEVPIIKDPVRFPLIRRAWDEVLAGRLPAEVLRRLNDKWGLRTRQFKRRGGGPLCRSAFYHLLSDPFYKGLIVLRTTGETFAGSHPPMVTVSEFDRVQEILGRPNRPRPVKHSFTYAGLLHCGSCGGVLTGEVHIKRSGRRFVYYRCYQQRSCGHCREPATPEPLLDEQVADRLERLALPPRMLTWLLDRVETVLTQEAADVEAITTGLQTSLEGVGREERILLDLRLRDLVTEGEFLERKESLRTRRRHLEERLRVPARSADDVKSLARRAFAFASCAAQSYRCGTTVRRRHILEAVASNPTVRNRKLEFSERKPFSLLSAGTPSSLWCTMLDDVRTFFRDSLENFVIPDLAVEEDVVHSSTETT